MINLIKWHLGLTDEHPQQWAFNHKRLALLQKISVAQRRHLKRSQYRKRLQDVITEELRTTDPSRRLIVRLRRWKAGLA